MFLSFLRSKWQIISLIHIVWSWIISRLFIIICYGYRLHIETTSISSWNRWITSNIRWTLCMRICILWMCSLISFFSYYLLLMFRLYLLLRLVFTDLLLWSSFRYIFSKSYNEWSSTDYLLNLLLSKLGQFCWQFSTSKIPDT